MASGARSETWSGTLYLARDFVLLHGGAGATAPHAHYAHQLLLSDHAPIAVEIDGRPLTASRILIESLREHAIVSAPPSLFVVYVEPLVIGAADLAQLDASGLSAAALAAALQRLPRRPPATRIADALDEIDALLDGKVRADAIAQRADLSLSQLERLFTAHVGLSVRRLVRWRRLRLALALALGGASLTAAAHGAGFADSAHFSRVMREMFGVRADRTLGGLQVRLID